MSRAAPGTGALAPPVRRALQAALEAEHQAVYGYGVVGAMLGDSARPQVASALAAHRARRDQLRTLLTDHGAAPADSAPAYELPEQVADEASRDEQRARRLALTLEERAAAFYADVVTVASGRVARLAAHALAESSVRAARWRGEPVAFPGLPERS